MSIYCLLAWLPETGNLDRREQGSAFVVLLSALALRLIFTPESPPQAPTLLQELGLEWAFRLMVSRADSGDDMSITIQDCVLLALWQLLTVVDLVTSASRLLLIGRQTCHFPALFGDELS